MSHGEIKPGDWQNLVTVQPGPVLHVWRGGADYCAVPLTPTATLALIGHLSAALQMAGGLNENLPFAAHKARRDAETAPFREGTE